MVLCGGKIKDMVHCESQLKDMLDGVVGLVADLVLMPRQISWISVREPKEEKEMKIKNSATAGYTAGLARDMHLGNLGACCVLAAYLVSACCVLAACLLRRACCVLDACLLDACLLCVLCMFDACLIGN